MTGKAVTKAARAAHQDRSLNVNIIRHFMEKEIF